MSHATERVLIAGDAGGIETFIDLPSGHARGVAFIAHPHPLFGGTFDNKVVQTLARAFNELGYVSLRPNFRGVGKSEGTHDNGHGETEDLMRVTKWARARFGHERCVLGGFSFGAYVQTRVAQRIVLERMVLIAPATGSVAGERHYATGPVPADTIVIHGEQDQTVPLANVFEWARPQHLPVVVIPGTDHFFHRRLILIRSIVKGAWRS